MEQELLNRTGKISVDISYMGFMVTPEIPLQNGDSGCSTCGGSCGSH